MKPKVQKLKKATLSRCFFLEIPWGMFYEENN